MAIQKFSMALALVTLSTAFGLLSNLAAAAEPESPTAELESIVVTAQKREENLQSVPVAVTAFTSQALQDMRFVNIGDLDAMAPGLSLHEGAGGDLTEQFAMRGVNGSSTFASDSGIALYVDGFYIASTLGSEFDLADVERVEVLRGPQGTLFGRNSIGGAINVITKEPPGEFHIRQQLDGGNLGQFRSKTSIDLPAWRILSASITFLHDEEDGDVRNLGAGTVWHYGSATGGEFGDRISPSTLGGHNTNAILAAVKLQTEDDIKAVYRYNHSHQDFSPDAVGVVAFPADGGATAGLLQGIYLNEPADFRTPISHTRPDAVNNWFSTEGTESIDSHTLTFSAPITENIAVKDLVGYRHSHVESTDQLSGLGGLYTSDLAAFGLDFYPPGTPFLPLESDTESDQRTFSNELQLNIDTRWVKSTLGYLYYRSNGNEGGLGNTPTVFAFAGLSSPAWVGYSEPPTGGPYVPQHSVIQTVSQAGYTQQEAHITDKLDVVGGIRYTKDTRNGTDGSPTPLDPPTTVSYDQGTWTYLGGVNYKVNADIFVYAHYSTGYISGGQLANIQFQPETARSWEAGFKGDLLQRTLRLNVAVFTVEYGSVQTLTSPAVANGGGCSAVPGVSLAASQCIINGGDAKASGFELETTYVTPIQGLTLSGNTAFNNMHFTKVDPRLRSPVDGTFVPQDAPRWTADVAAQYRGPDIGGLHGTHFMGRIDANYESSAYALSNTPLVDAIAADIQARTLLNGRLGLGGFNVAGGTLDIALYGKNITNNRGETNSAQFGFESSATYQKARTFGVEMNASF